MMSDCTDPRCTRINGHCVGYHCLRCGEPCSSQGHPNCMIRTTPDTTGGIRWSDITSATEHDRSSNQ